MFIILKGEHINHELEIVESWFANHLYLVIDLKTGNTFKHLRKTIKARLDTIAISVIHLCRLTTYLYREINALLEVRRELVTGTKLNVITKLAGYIETYTSGTGGYRKVKVTEHTALLALQALLRQIISRFYVAAERIATLCMNSSHREGCGYC
jgi:hypothetical protein